MDDEYACVLLQPYIDKIENIDDNTRDHLSFLSPKAYEQSCRILTLSVQGVTLNDHYNPTIARCGKQARLNPLDVPPTLFAPYTMTYDPDCFQMGPMGWPIQNIGIQQLGYEAVSTGKPSCIRFCQNGFRRLSPYTSHCSAYVAWIAQDVFGVSLVPTQIGDWCHAAAEQRDIMARLDDYWLQTDSITAQLAANAGMLAIVAHKVDDPTKEGYQQNGHIAIVLPIVWQVARDLQTSGRHYPTEPLIVDQDSFTAFVRLYGPEITQAGGLNFRHTVTANGFANYYPEGTTPGITPVDDLFEFFVYRHATQPQC